MLINVNGQSYTSWEDVPQDVRAQLAATLPDTDKNGIPDLFEGNLQGLSTGGQTFASTSIVVDGKPVQSAADLSPQMQAKLQQALGMLGPMLGAMAVPAAAPPGVPAVPAAPAGPAAPAPPDPNARWPLQPGQVMLNGVPTTVGEEPPKKPWWKRLFNG